MVHRAYPTRNNMASNNSAAIYQSILMPIVAPLGSGNCSFYPFVHQRHLTDKLRINSANPPFWTKKPPPDFFGTFGTVVIYTPLNISWKFQLVFLNVRVRPKIKLICLYYLGSRSRQLNVASPYVGMHWRLEWTHTCSLQITIVSKFTVYCIT